MFMLPASSRSVRQVSSSMVHFIRNFTSGSAISTSNGILAEYHRRIASGRLQPDGTQLAAVQALQLLQDSLAITAAKAEVQNAAAALPSNPAAAITDTADGHQLTAGNKPTALTENCITAVSSASGAIGTAAAAAAASSAAPAKPVVQGAYLWGPVGSGKTMLMDMFLKTLPKVQVPAGGGGTSTAAHGSSDNSSSSGVTTSAQVQELQLNSHRVHYHEFMLAVHERLHQMQQSLPKIVTYSRAGLPVYRYALPPEDPLLAIARDAAAGTHLLCLDELHVTDVADAMLLSRLFGELLRQGCMVLFTSNRPARDLYKGGLSRKYFEPFIKLINDRLLQLKVAGGKDYRSHLAQQAMQQQGSSHRSQQQQCVVQAPISAGSGAWYVGRDAQKQLQQHWQQLQQQLSELHAAVGAAEQEQEGGPVSLALPFGRSLWIPEALVSPQATHHNNSVLHHQQQQYSAGGQQHQQQQCIAAAYFTFEQICGNTGCRQSYEHAGALSATDHLALVRACPVIFIEGLPQLAPQHRDEARRLVTLVDILYEAHTARPGSVKLVVSAVVPPEEVFLPLLGAAAAQGINPNLGKSESKLNVQQLLQDYGSKTQASAGGDDFGAAAGEVGSSRSSSNQAVGSAAQPAAAAAPELRSSLLPEEVLMYHRASSRLSELCAVLQM